MIISRYTIRCCHGAGDVIVTSNLTVIITAHEDSNGIFHFVPPLSMSVQEGETASFQSVLYRLYIFEILTCVISVFLYPYSGVTGIKECIISISTESVDQEWITFSLAYIPFFSFTFPLAFIFRITLLLFPSCCRR